MAFRKIIKDSEGGQKYVTEQEEELVFDQVPTKGSFNPVTSGGVAKAIEETSDNITKLIPEGASEENKLVNESGLETALSEVNTAVESIEGKIPQSASSSNKMVTEQDLQEAQGSWQSGFTPKGESTISALNGLTDQSNGDQYVVTDSGTLTDGSLAVTSGETVAWDGTNRVWYKVNNYALHQFGTDNVKNLPTSISQFRNGDVIPVDGPNGPAKMPKDDLLKETAQNALAGNVAPAFDPNSTTTVAGLPYVYGGYLYVAKETYQGPWNPSKFTAVDGQSLFSLSKQLVKKTASALYAGYNGAISADGTWFDIGRHIAVPVTPGSFVSFIPRTINTDRTIIAFVTNAYIPGDHTSGNVPFVSGTSRILVSPNETYTYIIPKNTAYLILETIDGANNRFEFEITAPISAETILPLSEGSFFERNYFNKKEVSDKYLSYAGIVSTSTIWYEGGRHIAIPVKPGDVIKLKASIAASLTFVTDAYIPGDHTSGYVPFAVQNMRRQVLEGGAVGTFTAGVDAAYLILHVIDGDGAYVQWEIERTINTKEGSALFAESNDGDYISLHTLQTYAGIISDANAWFPTGLHKALPVTPGDRYRISTPINYGGFIAFVTDAYIPGDHTDGSVPFSKSKPEARILIKRNSSLEVTIPGDCAYIIFSVYDGEDNGVLFAVQKLGVTHKAFGVFQKLKIAHWNIGHFAMGMSHNTTIAPSEKAERQAAYREFINSIRPDILCVCEDNDTFCTDGTLASSAVYSCFEQQCIGKHSGYIMNSLYSNGLKILQFSWQSFPDGSGYGFSEILVDMDGTLVAICETHLTWQNYENRTAQIQYLINRYAGLSHAIIAGDWNIGPNNGGPAEGIEMQPFLDAGYRMSMMDYMPKQPTYSGNAVTHASNSSLDIICAKGFGLIGAEVSMDCADLSDHRLVYCELIKND